METTSEPKKTSTSMGLIGIAIIALVAIGIFAYSSSNKKQSGNTQVANTSTTASPSAAVASPTGAMMAASSYKDGTYTQDGAYMSPGGDESIGVKLTIKDGVVVDSEVTPHAERPMSQKFQSIFAENYKQFVVGKKIDDLKLDKVSGSSLSPKGFNDAVEKIKAEAKA